LKNYETSHLPTSIQKPGTTCYNPK